MLEVIKQYARRVAEINLSKSVYLYLSSKAFRTNKDLRSLLLHRRTGVKLGRNVEIVNKGRLEIGAVWPLCGHFDSFLKLGDGARLIVEGDFKIFTGCAVYVNENATLELGSGYIGNNLSVNCFNNIKIGHDVAISESVAIRDSDNHRISYSGYEPDQPVEIGDHVWIGTRATILKGVKVGDGSIVAAGAVVVRDVPANCLVGGVPARLIRENVRWE